MLRCVERKREILKKTIIDKRKNHAKLLPGFVNSKLRKKKGIKKLKVDDKEYEEDMKIATAMNEHFQSVFTSESVMGRNAN